MYNGVEMEEALCKILTYMVISHLFLNEGSKNISEKNEEHHQNRIEILYQINI